MGLEATRRQLFRPLGCDTLAVGCVVSDPASGSALDYRRAIGGISPVILLVITTEVLFRDVRSWVFSR